MNPVKISSYQKMKQRYEALISALQDDIAILVEEKDFMKVTIVKTKYKTQYKTQRDQENAIWFGDSSLKK